MKEPKWILDRAVYAIHAEQLSEHGGRDGIRDEGLLHSALDAPKNAFLYEEPDLFDLSAIYGYRISNNQPFYDGNKRTGYVVAKLFLLLNGYTLTATEYDQVKIFLDISTKKKSETEFAEWIRVNAKIL